MGRKCLVHMSINYINFRLNPKTVIVKKTCNNAENPEFRKMKLQVLRRCAFNN